MAQTAEHLVSQDPRAIKIMAKTLYRQLRSSGYARAAILSFASELLELVSSEVREQAAPGREQGD